MFHVQYDNASKFDSHFELMVLTDWQLISLRSTDIKTNVIDFYWPWSNSFQSAVLQLDNQMCYCIDDHNSLPGRMSLFRMYKTMLLS